MLETTLVLLLWGFLMGCVSGYFLKEKKFVAALGFWVFGFLFCCIATVGIFDAGVEQIILYSEWEMYPERIYQVVKEYTDNDKARLWIVQDDVGDFSALRTNSKLPPVFRIKVQKIADREFYIVVPYPLKKQSISNKELAKFLVFLNP